jgi:hypothetical protein
MRRARRRDRAARSGITAGVAFAGGVAGSLATSKVPYPRPGSTAEDIAAYFGQRPSPVRFGAPGQLLSAVTLGRFTASVAGLAGRSGSSALKAAAIAGGAVASASLAASAAHAVALARDPEGERAVALHRRMFLAGGPAHGAGFGVLLAVLGRAGSRTGALPRPLAVAALAAAVPNVLSPLYLAAEPAGWLIPIGRFPGLVIAGLAGHRLARGSRRG